jgi:anion-transporting  ArsA/GET3 family ATPase
MDLLERIARRRLVVVTGKGGVGKTLVTAALGRALAQRGRRVLAIEIDPRENLHRMLGVPPSGGEITPVGGGLAIQNLRSRDVLDEVLRERVRLGFVVRRVLRSPVYQSFAEGAPGLKELAILGHAFLLVDPPPSAGARVPRFDVVLLDAPATGHGLSLLTAPGLVSEVIQGGPFGEMAGELARFVADADRCGVALVAAAEEMPVDETLELASAVGERLRREPDLLVVNGLYPPLPAGTARIATDELGRLWVDRRRVNEEELARLRREWPAAWQTPWAELPLLPLESGPALVGALQRRLTGSRAA